MNKKTPEEKTAARRRKLDMDYSSCLRIAWATTARRPRPCYGKVSKMWAPPERGAPLSKAQMLAMVGKIVRPRAATLLARKSNASATKPKPKAAHAGESPSAEASGWRLTRYSAKAIRAL